MPNAMPSRAPVTGLMLRVLLAGTLFVMAPRAASGCPSCKTAVEHQVVDEASTGADPDAAGRGYNYSILLMISVPFLITAAMGIVLHRAIRRQPARGVPVEGGAS